VTDSLFGDLDGRESVAGSGRPGDRDDRRIGVLLPRAVDAPFDYLAPRQPRLSPGEFVRVPLRGGDAIGVVWTDGDESVAAHRLKRVSASLPLPSLSAETRRFLERAAAYTVTPRGMMLSLCFRPGWLGPPPRGPEGVQRTGKPLARGTAARQAVLDALADSGSAALPARELAARAGVSAGVVRGLLAAGVLARVALQPRPRANRGPALTLNPDQAAAADAVVKAVAAGGHRSFLLQGVTGSGKTEVYLEAVAEAARRGLQSLILLPEIALTDSVVRRISERFGAVPGLWHSRLAGGARRAAWRAAAEGRQLIFAGARSALFLPFCRLGLIVVDEEHDASFKQEDKVIYSARDMSVLRAHGAGVPVILATATPSLETWVNARRGRYRRLALPARVGGALLPETRAVDLRRHRPPPGRWLSGPVVEAVGEALAAGGQALLFLNRRGYAPLLVCGECGYRAVCRNCDVSLVVHRARQELLCHHCGYREPMPRHCPVCGIEGQMRPSGPGVERLAEEVAARFPEARRSLLSSDLSDGLGEELEAMAAGRVDICIGTQVVAKGHNFPKLRLVAVVDADICLSGSDFRAGERTFQTVRQVTGRAGREGGRSLALLQTADPGHPVIQAIVAGDSEAFLGELAGQREAAAAPPFGRYVAVIVASGNAGQSEAVARQLARNARLLTGAGIRLLGPAPAPLARLRSKWRWRLLVLAPRAVRVQEAVAAWRSSVDCPASVSIRLDVDPQNFL